MVDNHPGLINARVIGTALSSHVRDSGFRNAGRILGHPGSSKILLVKSEI